MKEKKVYNASETHVSLANLQRFKNKNDERYADKSHGHTPSEIGAVNKSGDTMTGPLNVVNNGGFKVSDGAGGEVSLNYRDNIARIRYGGNGGIASNGFNIEGPGEGIRFRIDDTGECFAKGTQKIYHSGNKPTPADVGAINKTGDTMTGDLNLRESWLNYKPVNVGNQARGMRIYNTSGTEIGSFGFQFGSATTDITNYYWGKGTPNNPWAAGESRWFSVGANGDVYANGSNRVYHQGFKPTKADVGLGNVNNWGASSAIGANSTTEYATTNMVAQVRAEKANNNHTHPAQTTVSGNAGTATKLQTARSINGTNFDGSGNITTANWGTARTFTVGDQAISVNGSANVSFNRKSMGVPFSKGSSAISLENGESCIAYVSNSLLGAPDGALYSHVYSDIWKHQIQGDYRTGQLAVRGKNNGTWQGWRTILDSGNYKSFVTPGNIGAMADGGTYGTIKLSNWIRTTGNTGWHSESYGGGWYMTDTTWIRTYGSKPIHVAGGDITCTNNIIAYYSDERLKKNFEKVDNALSMVMSINPYYYEQNEFAKELGYNEEGKIQIGFKAQEMEKILPQVIQEAPVNHRNDLSDEVKEKIGNDPIKTIDYGKLTPLLWKAIQEQQEQIEKLESILKKNNLM